MAPAEPPDAAPDGPPDTALVLRAFYDHSPFLMGLTELLPGGDIRHVYDNPATCRFFGVADGATAGKRALADLGADPAAVRVWREAYLKSRVGGRPERLEHTYRVGGARRVLAATVFPLAGAGGAARFCYVAEDVTAARAAQETLRRGEADRDRAEASLRARTEQLNFALASTGVGMWLNTMPLGRLDWDARTRELFFIPPDVEPTIELFWSRLHPDDRGPTRRAVEAALRDRTLYAIDHRAVDPASGRVRWVRSAGQATYDAAGNPVRFDGVNYDITDRKMLEEELRQSAARLAEQDRRKDEFLATLAHELRNPLAPIRSAVQILKAPGPAGGELGWARDVIDRQIGQMARLLDDLLDVARVTRGKLQLRKGRVALGAVVAAAVETSRPVVEECRQQLSVELPGRPVLLEADETRLAQVFANLLNNAAKYSEPGGHIRLAAARRGGEVEVSVRDTGIGLQAGQLQGIFEMFAQAEPARERSQGGLGIGLALVRGLVELHGGRVEARSEGPGRGSEFVVRLPALPDGDERGAGAAGGDGPAVTMGLRVLVVDDNRDGADTLALVLRLWGNETRTAYDGPEGVRAAAEFRPDAILLDLGLPGLSGYEACRRIREQTGARRPVIIAQTGWGQEEDRQKTRAAGFDHHLVKPVDTGELARLLAGVRPGRA